MPKRSAGELYTIAQKFHSIVVRFADLPRVFKLVWEASRSWMVAWITLLILQGILPAIHVSLSRSLVNGAVKVVGAGVSLEAIQPILVPAILIAVVMLLSEVLQSLSGWIRTAQSELVQDHISELVHRQAITVDYAFYESSDYHDRMSRATANASGEAISLVDNTSGFIQSTITLLAIAALLLSYGIGLPILLLVSTLPAFYVLLRLNRQNHLWWERTTTARRWLQYYELLMTHPSAVGELRLFDLGKYFYTAYQQLRRRLRREKVELAKQRSIGRLRAGIVSLILSGSVLLWIARQVLLGAMTLGDLALFYQAFSKGQQLVRSVLNNLGQIYNNSLFLKNLFDFLQLQSQLIEPHTPKIAPIALKQEIKFRHVSFRYPGSDRYILQDFNLSIPAGKMVAIVGDNGAGKSTLFKLICRFYDPEVGSLEWDGVNLRELSTGSLRRSITALFQAPVPYYVTAAQNIVLGDLSASPKKEEIETAARRAGIHDAIERLPKGYDSLMGKGFAGGNEFSGGEWQRLALARAFLRRAPIMLLDEPTSAMDPWAEIDWLDRFRHLAKGRTAIVITHRFTLAMRADIIYVMSQGQMIESGNHNELLDRNGLYAKSWKAQMQIDSKIGVEQNLA